LQRLAAAADDKRMSGELITDLAGIGAIEDEWRALAERRANAFVTPEWLRAWWEHQGKDTSSLLIVAVRGPGGELVGVMPLAADDSSRPRAVRFAGAGLGDRFHPVAAIEDEPAVAAAAMAALGSHLGRRILLLERVEPDRPWLAEMRNASPRRLAATVQSPTDLPYVPLEGLDWETYVSQRSPKFRSQIRRRERVLLRDHEMKVLSAEPGNLGSTLDEFFRLHALRWEGRGESALATPEGEAVLRAFAEAALERDWLRLLVLEAEGTAVAAFLGWRIGDSYVSYNTGFDPEWSKRAVGTVMTSVAIRNAIEEEAKEFDFLLGTEPYKRNFTPEARDGATVVMTGALRPTRFLIAGEARARRVGRRIADRPALGKVAHAVARLLPTSRG